MSADIAIARIANYTAIDSLLHVPVTIIAPESEADTILVTAVSSTQGLLPDHFLVIEGSGLQRTLSAFPRRGATGTMGITVRAHHPVLGSAEAMFTITIGRARNDEYLRTGRWMSPVCWDEFNVPESFDEPLTGDDLLSAP